jgi:hypothetical protein
MEENEMTRRLCAWIPLLVLALTTAVSPGFAQTARQSVQEAVILLDTTESMRGLGPAPDARNVWPEVSGSVRDLIDGLAPGTRVVLIPFDTGPHWDRIYPAPVGPANDVTPVAMNSAADRLALQAKVQALAVDGQATYIYESVQYGLAQLRRWSASEPEVDHQQFIYLYTDGLDNGPHKNLGMEGIAGLFGAAKADNRFLYVVYNTIPTLPTAAATAMARVATTVPGLPKPYVIVQQPELDFGDLSVPGRTATRDLALSSNLQTGGMRMMLSIRNAPTGLKLLTNEAVLAGQVPITLSASEGLVGGFYADTELVLTDPNGGFTISPNIVRLRFSWPTPSPTNTQVPLTATSTPLPTTTPRPKATLVASTPTPVPPTATATFAPSPTRPSLPSVDLGTLRLDGTPRQSLEVTLPLSWSGETKESHFAAKIEPGAENPAPVSAPNELYLRRPKGTNAVLIVASTDDQELTIGYMPEQLALGPGTYAFSGVLMLDSAGVFLRGQEVDGQNAAVVRWQVEIPRPLWHWLLGGLLLALLVGGLGYIAYDRFLISLFSPDLYVKIDGSPMEGQSLLKLQRLSALRTQRRVKLGSTLSGDQRNIAFAPPMSHLLTLGPRGSGVEIRNTAGSQDVHVSVNGQEILRNKSLPGGPGTRISVEFKNTKHQIEILQKRAAEAGKPRKTEPRENIR